MNRDVLAGSWKKLKGKVKENWGKLTNDELDEIAGREEQLLGAIQRHYGLAKEDAKKQVDSWLETLETTPREPRLS